MTPTENIPPKANFPKAEHLKSRKAIEQLFRSGKNFFVHPYKVFYTIQHVDEPQPYPAQAGFAVSTRNFKHAVDRNRIKRLGREAYRLNKQILLGSLVHKKLLIQVFFVFTDKTLPTFDAVQQKMKNCLSRLAGLLERLPAASIPQNPPHEKLL